VKKLAGGADDEARRGRRIGSVSEGKSLQHRMKVLGGCASDKLVFQMSPRAIEERTIEYVRSGCDEASSDG